MRSNIRNPISRCLLMARFAWQTGSRLIYIVLRRWTFPLSSRKANIIASQWGCDVLRAMEVSTELEGEPINKGPTLFVGNHMGYLDIPLFFSFHPCNFVSKEEVRRWFLIGPGAHSVGTVFVKRESGKSRQKALVAMAEAIKKEGKSITIFPEGTSTVEGTDWKRGVFTLAKEYGITVQPFRVYYSPPRRASYIGDDNFLRHYWNFLKFKDNVASIRFFKPRKITDANQDRREIQKLVQQSWQEKHALMANAQPDEEPCSNLFGNKNLQSSTLDKS